ncbi:MAG: signal peptide peptidase SppA [bacterium]|nr:signal peptide peptidase SppA [bacterium]
MKKSTGIFILLSLFFFFLILVAVFVTLMVYLVEGTTPNILGSDRLALVRIIGPIYTEQDWIDEIESYQEDHTIKGIVLEIDSPGGAVGPSQNLYNAVLAARKDYGKIVVAYFNSVAASGGYYIGCGADRIVSTPGAMTGSIGVYAKFLQGEKLFEKLGIKYETVKAGKYKDFGSFDRPLTDDERQMLQAVIDDTYMQFIEAVSDNRAGAVSDLLKHWSPSEGSGFPFTPPVLDVIKTFQEDRDRFMARAAGETASTTGSATATPSYEPDMDVIQSFVRATAEGKVYTGRQALKIALVDKVGTFDDAVDLAADLAGIRGEPTIVEKKQDEISILDLLSQKLSSYLPASANTESPIQYRLPF